MTTQPQALSYVPYSLSPCSNSLFLICAMVVMLVSDSIYTSSSPSYTLLESSEAQVYCHHMDSRWLSDSGLITWLDIHGFLWSGQPSLAVFSPTNPFMLLYIYLTVEPKCTPILFIFFLPLFMLPFVSSSPTILSDQAESFLHPSGRNNVFLLLHPLAHFCHWSVVPVRVHLVLWLFVSISPVPINFLGNRTHLSVFHCTCCTAIHTEATQKMWINEWTNKVLLNALCPDIHYYY